MPRAPAPSPACPAPGRLALARPARRRRSGRPPVAAATALGCLLAAAPARGRAADAGHVGLAGHVEDAEVAAGVATRAEADAELAARAAAGDGPERPNPEVHGLAFMALRAPAQGRGGLNLLLVQGELDGRDRALQLYVAARLRVLPDGGSPDEVALFLQQAFGAWHHRFGAVKLGKILASFGRPWDYGFYGPLLANLDAKQQPELGVAAEGSPSLGKDVALGYALQYFPVDGRAFALRNRTWFARSNVRREHQLVARVAPTLRLGEARTVGVGASYARLVARRGPVPGNVVQRGAVDVAGELGPVQAFVEAGRQMGYDEAAMGGAPIGPYRYLWAGTMVTVDPVKVRYHVNTLVRDDGGWDVLHQPGVEVDLHERVGLLLEAAVWRGAEPAAAPGWREQALYLVLNGRV